MHKHWHSQRTTRFFPTAKQWMNCPTTWNYLNQTLTRIKGGRSVTKGEHTRKKEWWSAADRRRKRQKGKKKKEEEGDRSLMTTAAGKFYSLHLRPLRHLHLPTFSCVTCSRNTAILLFFLQPAPSLPAPSSIHPSIHLLIHLFNHLFRFWSFSFSRLYMLNVQKEKEREKRGERKSAGDELGYNLGETAVICSKS